MLLDSVEESQPSPSMAPKLKPITTTSQQVCSNYKMQVYISCRFEIGSKRFILLKLFMF